jgi:hypothetical protein
MEVYNIVNAPYIRQLWLPHQHAGGLTAPLAPRRYPHCALQMPIVPLYIYTKTV